MGNSENKWDINANTINATTINGNNITNGVKAAQSAVADPTAEGTSIEFIDSISQNAQGVIAPTKKTVATATTSTAGLISAEDKTKLNGIETGAEVNPDIVNNLTETTTGKVLDATQGKILKDAIDNLDTEINSLDAEDVGAIKDDYNYTYMGSPYTGNELILLHNTTTGVNSVTDVASFLSSASGGSGTNQGALVHYTKTISVSAGSTAQTFPNSGTDDNITENMIVLQAVISNPAAQGSDWTFTTANGTVTLNGTVNAATNVTLYFGVQMSVAPSIQVNLASTSADNILKANPQPGVMGALGVPNGGTGATTPAGACASIGAVKKSGDTMTGSLTIGADIIQTSGMLRGQDGDSHTNHALKLGHNSDDVMQFFEYGGQFDFIKSNGGSNTTLFQIKDGVSAYPLPVNNGGTGATTPAGARSNIGAIAPEDLVVESKFIRGSAPKGTSTSHDSVSFTKTGYRPLFWTILPSSYCDYLCINLTPGISNDALTTGTYYTGNWSNTDVSEYTIQINILWLKK